MKYIDADRLRAAIEEKYRAEIRPWLSGVSATSVIYDYVLPLIDSLQQEQQIGEEYAIEIGKHTHTLRVGSQSDIDNLIRQEKQDQSEVDLEKASRNVYESWMGGTMDDVRRDMAELGKVLNARKEN